MGYGETMSEAVENVAREIVDATFKVHRTLGPGLLESVYEACLEYELRRRGLKVLRQLKVPIFYDGVELDADLRVEGCVIVEIKSVEAMNPVFKAQALTYLKLTGHRLCLLINFNVPLIKDGIKRVVL